MCVAAALCKSRSIVLVGGCLIGFLRSASVCDECVPHDRVTVSLVAVTESFPVNSVSRNVSHRLPAFGAHDEVRSVRILRSVRGSCVRCAMKRKKAA